MPIDLSVESPLTLAEAARTVPAVGGKRPSPSTIFRWLSRGLRGVRLEHARIGHRVVTSGPAMARFFAALAEADRQAPAAPAIPSSTNVKPRTPAARARAVEQAKRELAAAGV